MESNWLTHDSLPFSILPSSRVLAGRTPRPPQSSQEHQLRLPGAAESGQPAPGVWPLLATSMVPPHARPAARGDAHQMCRGQQNVSAAPGSWNELGGNGKTICMMMMLIIIIMIMVIVATRIMATTAKPESSKPTATKPPPSKPTTPLIYASGISQRSGFLWNSQYSTRLGNIPTWNQVFSNSTGRILVIRVSPQIVLFPSSCMVLRMDSAAWLFSHINYYELGISSVDEIRRKKLEKIKQSLGKLK